MKTTIKNLLIGKYIECFVRYENRKDRVKNIYFTLNPPKNSKFTWEKKKIKIVSVFCSTENDKIRLHLEGGIFAELELSLDDEINIYDNDR